jgi:hypothetical protein
MDSPTDPIRLMGKAFYNEWVEGVRCCEPKFEELPECYLLQLDDCMRAAVRAVATSEWQMSGMPASVPNEENIGATDEA